MFNNRCHVAFAQTLVRVSIFKATLLNKSSLIGLPPYDDSISWQLHPLVSGGCDVGLWLLQIFHFRSTSSLNSLAKAFTLGNSSSHLYGRQASIKTRSEV